MVGPPSLCSTRWVWDPTGLSGRDPVEVTVFCSETGGKAEGKWKFVCCKAWVGWWEGWRAGSLGDIFRGFDCIGKRAQDLQVTLKPQTQLTSSWSATLYRDSTTLVRCVAGWELGNGFCAWVGARLGSSLLYTIAWSPFCFPGSCIPAAFPTHHPTACVFKWGTTSFFWSLQILFEGEQQPFRTGSWSLGIQNVCYRWLIFWVYICKIGSLRWLSTY